MLAAMVVSLAGGQLITRTGHYKALPIAGGALLAMGLFLFSTMGLDTPAWLAGIYMAVLGAGMGCMMQTTNPIAQNSVRIKDIGAATGTSTFARNMGGSRGISVLGSTYASRLLKRPPKNLPSKTRVRVRGLSGAAVRVSIVVRVSVIVRESAEVPGEVEGHRRCVVFVNGDPDRGAAQDVQGVQAVPEEFFGQALAAVVRVREKFIDDCFAVAFGDDDGGSDPTIRS